MQFHVVEDGKLRMEAKYMCDNDQCRHHNNRYGMPLEKARLRFRVVSGQEFDACCDECRDVIAKWQHYICI
ncbi:MAG: hypothetical protein COV31_00675 [Candidatus Yanofskybacteria bacterium CG10_big_fil_rev_8_21_14_0_10_46_23]|uniref:Uncharacterized protein n=1 Tax=Candidatus Yanofskybacteria bacterium CG10_big_fil_rev_8_21_14_0_10_46_23 TaxID=1975098 RepID=A0A2H0R5J6_9BACT|nr:MAG: hypothetical protein COV31_00675 [Candidatus Yanofskybacteria bacterium CG10_big_fil_rev_8_21_14_0_10_46_23]